MEQLETLLSEGELAALAQVPRGTVRHWRDVGKGPAYLRIGRHVRYRPSDVQQWLDRQRVRVPTGDVA